jgi:hypothetical protein
MPILDNAHHFLTVPDLVYEVVALIDAGGYDSNECIDSQSSESTRVCLISRNEIHALGQRQDDRHLEKPVGLRLDNDRAV